MCHCRSAWLPPADTPSILQAQDVREDSILDLFQHHIIYDKSFYLKKKNKSWHYNVFSWETQGHNMHSSGWYGEMSCLVSAHLQSFPVCLLWHDIYIVLSTPTPELVSKSRFNLHASCLQEEEVEEFRVSLSWYRFHPVSVWTSRTYIHPAPPPP